MMKSPITCVSHLNTVLDVNSPNKLSFPHNSAFCGEWRQHSMANDLFQARIPRQKNAYLSSFLVVHVADLPLQSPQETKARYSSCTITTPQIHGEQTTFEMSPSPLASKYCLAPDTSSADTSATILSKLDAMKCLNLRAMSN